MIFQNIGILLMCSFFSMILDQVAIFSAFKILIPSFSYDFLFYPASYFYSASYFLFVRYFVSRVAKLLKFFEFFVLLNN